MKDFFYEKISPALGWLFMQGPLFGAVAVVAAFATVDWMLAAGAAILFYSLYATGREQAFDKARRWRDNAPEQALILDSNPRLFEPFELDGIEDERLFHALEAADKAPDGSLVFVVVRRDAGGDPARNLHLVEYLVVLVFQLRRGQWCVVWPTMNYRSGGKKRKVEEKEPEPVAVLDPAFAGINTRSQ